MQYAINFQRTSSSVQRLKLTYNLFSYPKGLAVDSNDIFAEVIKTYVLVDWL